MPTETKKMDKTCIVSSGRKLGLEILPNLKHEVDNRRQINKLMMLLKTLQFYRILFDLQILHTV